MKVPVGAAQETDSLLPVGEADRRGRSASSGDRHHAPGTLKMALGSAILLLIVLLGISNIVSGRWGVPGAADLVLAPTSSEDGVFAHLLGRSKRSSTKTDDMATCTDGDYSKRTLKLAYELPFASLFRDNKGQRKYEASSVIVKNGTAYAVCDSSWAIARFDAKLEPFAKDNVQVGDPAREEADSGYEALFDVGDTFYVVRESIDHGKKHAHDLTGYHAIIEELAIQDDDYQVVQKCPVEFEFEGSSKGFEGAVAIHDLNGELVVLGLCEGNHCSEKYKDDRGNGVLVAMRRGNDFDGHCQWKTIRQISIPKSARFRDYSAITLQEDTGRVAIASQEESQIWVGELLGRNSDGFWDVDRMGFNPYQGRIYDFPKNHECETIYCNVEGVHWLNDDMIIAVSDKMKGRGKQDFRCFDKDQSVHVFVLPD